VAGAVVHREIRLTAQTPSRRGSGGASPEPRIAVLAPCHNEAATIGQVVADFAAAVGAHWV